MECAIVSSIDDKNEVIIAEDITSNDFEVLTLFIQEANERFASKQDIRLTNIQANTTRPNELHFTKLDSSLKKNSAFVKKIRNFSGPQIDTYIRDMVGLNLSKYISEIASALVDAKLKLTDIPAAIKMCSVLHQTYSDFSIFLFENWQKILSFKIGDKIPNPSKLRVDIRFYAELVQAAVFTNKNAFTLLGNVLTTLANIDKEDHTNSSIVLTFAKHCGEDYAGLVPRRMRELSDKYNIPIPKSTFLPVEKQQNVRSLLKEYYISLCKHVVENHDQIQHLEKQNVRILQTKGEVSQDHKERLETAKLSFHKIYNCAQSFAEILDEDLPVLKSAIITKDDENIVITGTGVDFSESTLSSADHIWGDSETQKFYCDLPELRAYLPTSFLNTTPASSATSSQRDASITEEVLDSELPEDDLTIEEPVAEVNIDEEPEDPVTNTVSNKILLDAFLNNLPNCVNRELIDNAAIDFILTINTRHNRHKLIRSLFCVHRTRLDLLPFYGRFVAILHPALPEIANELCEMLKRDFKYQVREKNQINIESKVKVVRFIGELVKFNMYSKVEALYCLKVLLYDFSHHHIEMACNLLEVCGRYLYCNPEAHHRTKVYLEQMMRKKAVLALDSRYVAQIENAYYCVNPPETDAVEQKKRPIMHQFIRKLLYQDLQKNSIDKVLKTIRKLDWNNAEIASYTVKCLSSSFNMKYFNIRWLANLISGLVGYQEEIGTRVVDSVLEDIRLGMEVNLPKWNQRRVSQICYLGELYNYRMVESADIFKVLYSIITFGVSMDPNVISPIDHPDHLLRIRLACVLLETCGTYFSSGSSKRRLDYFLVFLQAYYCFKKYVLNVTIPPTLDYFYKETLTMLRPKLNFFDSYEKTQVELEKIRTTLGIDKITAELEATKISDGLETITETDNEDQDEVSDTLAAGNTDDTGTETEMRESEDENEQEISENEQMDTKESFALRNGPTPIKCREDDDFLHALDRMVSENIQERMRESVKNTNVDISVPMLIKSANQCNSQIGNKNSGNSTAEDTEPKTNFVLMMRKGNKQQYRNFEADSDLVQNLRDQEIVQKAEKERLKRLTLNITERLEEEDNQDMAPQQSKSIIQNMNRERKKYQHPKGAPDADLIFGPKKVR